VNNFPERRSGHFWLKRERIEKNC